MFEDMGQPLKVELIREKGDADRHRLPPGAVRRLLPRAPRRLDRAPRERQAAFRLRRLLEGRRARRRRCSGSTAPSSPPRRSSTTTSRMLEEAKKRDHRRLGTELDLFSTNDELGGGLILWHPKGARVRAVIEQHWRERHWAGGYDILFTPHIGRAALWQTSGHLGFYKDSMYSPMDIDEAGLLPQADELPLPHPDLQVPDALLPRPAPALGRARHRLPLRAQRHPARPAPRPRLHPGRRPHHLHARADRGRDPAGPRFLGLHPGRLRLHRQQDRAVRPRPQEPRRSTPARTTSGARPRPRSSRPWRPAAIPTSAMEGEAVFYGPEDRHQDQGRHRPATGSARPSSSTSTCPSAST